MEPAPLIAPPGVPFGTEAVPFVLLLPQAETANASTSRAIGASQIRDLNGFSLVGVGRETPIRQMEVCYRVVASV